MPFRTRTYSIQSIISSAIMIAILVVASIIMAISFNYSRDLSRDAALDRIQLLASELESLLDRTFLPAKRSLSHLRWDELAEAQTTAERLGSIPKLVEWLKSDPVTDAIYMGYNDGDFILVRPIRHTHVRDILGAPVDARYVGEFIEQEGLQEWLFFDENLKPVGKRVDPKVTYDPRTRPWYSLARNSDELQVSAPYVFFTTREAGVTLSQRAPNGTIVGIDFALNDLSSYLAEQAKNEGLKLALVTPDQSIIASPNTAAISADQQALKLHKLSDYPELVLNQFVDIPKNTLVTMATSGGDQLGYRMSIFDQWNIQIDMLIGIPADKLLGDIGELKTNAFIIALTITLFMLFGGWWLGRIITMPLKKLSQQVTRLAAFDFNHQDEIRSGISEVNDLSHQLGIMTDTISRFRKIAYTLANEQDTDHMMHRVNRLLAESVNGKRSLLYLYNLDEKTLTRASHYGHSKGTPELITDVPNNPQDQIDILKKHLPNEPYEHLVIPLFSRENNCLGLIEIELFDNSLRKNADYRKFVTELSSLAATAISTRELIAEQQNLTEAIIKLLADAIDAKSPYTHNHCARVPELSKLLVAAAERSNTPDFKDFKLNDQQRYTINVAAWLHDCGKITSPEYVVDKAVKLETLYNRIHEIRTRFEVLWRDAEIRYLKGIIGGDNQTDLSNKLKATKTKLKADFDLIARANIGDVPLEQSELEQIKEIAETTWVRHFDRRIGLSFAESERLHASGKALETLPVREKLLVDRPDHIHEWGERVPPVQTHDPNNIWGFNMDLPACALNMGELYNLSIPRGTLTQEERFKINEHVVQSIIMIKSLPLPQYLRDVPNIAGNHHERMDGLGYPRKLKGSELSIPERIMAIADVFEALTASDRPYKPAKSLSESLVILAHMAADGHLDPSVFTLFVEEEVYQEYATKFLEPTQIDPVDKRAILKIFEARTYH